MPPKHLTKLIHNQRVVQMAVCNKRRILRAVYNGETIWELDLTAKLELEKQYVWLLENNAWENTNRVYTNRTFKVN